MRNTLGTCGAPVNRTEALLAHFPLHSLRGLRPDPPEKARPHGTLADTDGELDWDKVTRLAWRPAWAIRSRRGAWTALCQLFRRR